MIPFTTFYGMRMNPFDKELPSRDAYKTLDMEQTQGRLNHLKDHPGLGLFTAAPGQGKTFSLRYFSDGLNPNQVKFYYICLSTVSATEFYRQLCVKLGLEVSYKKTVMFQRIQEYFYSMCMNKNVHCMICLDEAQYLNSDILRDLKMLCNFCMDSKNCFSLILLGQPVLVSLMMRQPNEALRQRIAVSYSFVGLSENEAGDYIRDRMELSGATPCIFDENAVTVAYASCNSSLRQLNLILTKALTIGAQNQKQNVDTDMILAAVNDISLA